jgi:ribonuclease P protein component
VSLKRRRDFRRIRANGRKGRSDGIVVFAVPSDRPRVGLTVKTGKGGAVARNRARRRVREAFRAQEIQGFDVIVVADEEAARLEFSALAAHLEKALGAAGVGRGQEAGSQTGGKR